MGCKKITYYESEGSKNNFFLRILGSEKRVTAKKIGYNRDHLGNTRVVYTPLNAECGQGTAEEPIFGSVDLNYAADYYPYGKVLREFNPKTEKYVTTHHERDTETGLDYRGARYYDADVARFLSLDPHAADYVNWSDYVYVAGNPVSFVDADGKDAVFWEFTRDDNGQANGVKEVTRVKGGNDLYFIKGTDNSYHLVPESAQGGSLTNVDPEVINSWTKGDEAYKWANGVNNITALGETSSIIIYTVAGGVKSPKVKAVNKPHTPTDYSKIKNPKNVNASTKPTPRQVKEMHAANKKHNGGVLKDDVTGETMVKSKKSQKGVTPPSNEAQVDHINPVSKGGTREMKNLQLRTRKNNRDKSNKTPDGL